MRQTLIVLAGMLMFSTNTARAVPPDWFTGDFAIAGPPVVSDIRFAGTNIILMQTSTFNLTGDLVGVYTGEERSVIRTTGEFTGQALRTFTGTLDGQAGTLIFREVFTGDSAVIEGHVTSLGGTGALAGVNCQGTFVGGSATGVGTYALRCR